MRLAGREWAGLVPVLLMVACLIGLCGAAAAQDAAPPSAAPGIAAPDGSAAPQDMKIEPDLAESYERPDDTTYIFKLRRGVKFHNGQDFTAEDVTYTFQRILDPATASRLRSQYSGIEAVTAIYPFTVKFKLKTTDAAFLNYLATNPDGAIVPKGVADLSTQPVGRGAHR